MKSGFIQGAYANLASWDDEYSPLFFRNYLEVNNKTIENASQFIPKISKTRLNFGMEKVRCDYEGQRTIMPASPTTYTFKIPRQRDLLLEAYLVISLPNIWSPILPPLDGDGRWREYDFRWIRDIGTMMIEEAIITANGAQLQRITGEYMKCIAERDFPITKMANYNRMTGNVPELNDPASIAGRSGMYPNAFWTSAAGGAEPSIRGRELFIPLHFWFGENDRLNYPLCATALTELAITIRIRSFGDLFQVRDVTDAENNFPYIRPDFTRPEFQVHRFLQTPPSIQLNDYVNTVDTWNANIYIMTTQASVTEPERQFLATNPISMMVKTMKNYIFPDVTGTKRVKLDAANGFVSGWTFFLRRNDAFMRNEWTNFSNWPYQSLPMNLFEPPETVAEYSVLNGSGNIISTSTTGPMFDLDGSPTGIYITGPFSDVNRKEIMETFGIICDGNYREKVMVSGVYDYCERYRRTHGCAASGIYFYSFALDNPDDRMITPEGALNCSKFKNIEFELTTFMPPLDPTKSNFQVICNDDIVVGVQKQNWQLLEYTYELNVFEESYNYINIENGLVGLQFNS